MEHMLDHSDNKQRILNDVSKCIKSVYVDAANSQQTLTASLSLCSPLVTSVDGALQHGLLNVSRSYWALVRGCSHAQTMSTIETWTGASASAKLKAQAWVLATLAEGSLLSYLECIVRDSRAVLRLYAPHAIMRDCSSVSELTSLVAGLSSIRFISIPNSDRNMEPNTNIHQLAEDPSHRLTKSLDLHLEGISKNSLMTSSTTTMTSSMTSSLASPGDSGFTQLDSETDTASISEIAMEPDSTSMKEDISDDSNLPRTNSSSFNSSKVSNIEKKGNSAEVTSLMKSHKAEHIACTTRALDDAPDGLEFQNDCDEIVYRRPKNRKGKTLSVKQNKRVSFHEESSVGNGLHLDNAAKNATESWSGSLKSASSPNISLTKSELSLLVQLNQEQEGVEIGEDLSISDGHSLDSPHYSSPKWASPSSTGTFKLVRKIQPPKTNSEGISASSIMCAVKTFIVGSPSRDKHIAIKSAVSVYKVVEAHDAVIFPAPVSGQDINYSSAVSQKSSDSEQSVDAAERLRDQGSVSPVPSCSSLRPQVSTPRRTPNRLSSPSSRLTSTPSNSSVLSQPPSKGCLVNRFLRSITEKKIANGRASATVTAAYRNRPKSRKCSLFIRGAKPVEELSKELLAELDEEMQTPDKPPQTNHLLVDITIELNHLLHTVLLSSPREHIYKVMKVQSASVSESGARQALFAVLTDRALYTCDKNGVKQNMLYHTQLDSILMGPNLQWLVFKGTDGGLNISIIVGDCGSAAELVSSIELAVRRNRVASARLPAVKQISYEDLSAIPGWAMILQDETIDYYCLVHAVEESSSPPSTPLGPTKKGHFMFRAADRNIVCSWEPGFFVLKAGVLYNFLTEEDVLPHSVLVLNGVQCCRPDVISRPHTIEVGSLQLAAPDEYAASDWLQALKRASSGVYESTVGEQRVSVLSGSLILTESRLLLLSSLGLPLESSDTAHPFCVVFISDIASLRFGGANCRWFILELSCREACETGGDYILFFNTCCEMVAFKDKLLIQCPSLAESTSVVSDVEPVRKCCEKIDDEFFIDWKMVSST